MSRPAERQMAVVRPKQIQTVWIGKAIWVAVRGSQARYNPRTLLDGLSTELHVRGRDASGVLDRRLEAQQFLDCGGNDPRMSPQLFERLRGVKQRQKSAGNQIGGGFMAADKRDDGVYDYFFIGEAVAVNLRGHQRINQAVGG